jgi:hypothetical protein
MSKRSPVDWEGINREYRAGQLSVREIARAFAISDTAVHKKAREQGWQRDLTDRVRGAVSERLVRDAVPPEVQPQTDDEIVEASAARGADVVRRHQRGLANAYDVAEKVLAELNEATEHAAEIAEVIEEETAGDDNGKRRQMMLRAVNVSARAQAVATLSVAFKNIVTVERRAFNLDDAREAAASDPLTELLRQISGNSFRPVE